MPQFQIWVKIQVCWAIGLVDWLVWFSLYLYRIFVLWWTLLQGHHSATGKTDHALFKVTLAFIFKSHYAIDLVWCSVMCLCLSIKVLEVVTFLTSHNLAGGGERISVPYAALSQRYDQLRRCGDGKYVAHQACSVWCHVVIMVDVREAEPIGHM